MTKVDSRIDRILYPLRLLFVTNFSKPVLIWNIGKVASTSVARSLQTSLGKAPVLTTHFLDVRRSRRSDSIRRILIEPKKRKLNIITLTREPVGRSVSSFFQNFQNNTGQAPEHFGGTAADLLRLYLNKNDVHYKSLEWFDDNLMEHLDIDVYSVPFKFSDEHVVIENEHYRVLVLRSEAEDKDKESAIRSFLELDDFRLVRENVGQQKPYSALYKRFVDEVHLPSCHIERLLDSRYAQHFYTELELAQIRSRWQST